MRLRAVYVKPRRGGPVREVAEVRAVAGVGLEGDCQRDPASPRQVLIVAASVVDELGVGEELTGNLIVEGDVELVSGMIVRVGDVRLRVTFPCEACGKLERVRVGLRRAVEGRRGVLARVLSSGVMAAGMDVEREAGRVRALETAWQARVVDVARRIPAGRVMTYQQLARCAGVHPVYARAFPRILRGTEGAVRVVPNRRGVAAEVLWDGASMFTDDERVVQPEVAKR